MIAQALLNEPEVLVLDEPTNGLDPRQIIDVRELIRALSARHTILVTSHILTEIERVATRVAILLNGRLLSTQSLEQAESPRLRIRVRSAAPGPVRASLSTAPGVTGILSEARLADGVHEFVVRVTTPAAAEAVAASIAAGGFGLLEMTEARTDLEALFLDLTAQAAA